jgi:serine acetyltransferase
VSGLRRRLLSVAQRDSTVGRVLRGVVRSVRQASLPLPMPVAGLYRTIFVLGRGGYHWCMRVLVAEPIFRGYATRVGTNFHTGVYVHWIMGDGSIVVGDDSRIDGKCNIMFAWSAQARPEFVVGNRTHIGHECSFTIARSIRIGDDCLFASNVRVMDSSAHPVDPERRRRGERPSPDDVRPVVIGNNVWVGAGAMILPGVSIGDGSVIGAGSVVTRDVPAGVVAAGAPARVIRSAHEADATERTT